MTTPENPDGLVSAAREYQDAVAALEAGERWSVTRVKKAESALLNAALITPTPDHTATPRMTRAEMREGMARDDH